MNKIKIYIIIAGVVVALIGSVVGVMVGFPWEHIIAVNNAREYVVKTYGFTITKTSLSMLLDYPVIATVSTKENLFDFEVDMGRGHLDDISDNYLDCLAMYVLGRELNDYVIEVTEQKSKVYTYMRTGEIHTFSLAELEADPNIVFEKLKKEYNCIISSDEIVSKDYQFNYNILYDIYSHVFEYGLEPLEITFSYNYCNNDSYLFVTINDEDFQNINSPEDLKPYFERAITKTKT